MALYGSLWISSTLKSKQPLVVVFPFHSDHFPQGCRGNKTISVQSTSWQLLDRKLRVVFLVEQILPLSLASFLRTPERCKTKPVLPSIILVGKLYSGLFLSLYRKWVGFHSLYECFRKYWYPQVINSNSRVFPYKPSILGYPYSWKHPYMNYISRLNRPLLAHLSVSSYLDFVFSASLAGLPEREKHLKGTALDGARVRLSSFEGVV